MFSAPLPAAADTRIRGEFEYNLDDRELSEWQIGPVFSLHEAEDLELEVPVGQDDSEWFIEPELTYEIDLNDFTLELSVGTEILLNSGSVEPFGSLEGSVDF